MSPAKSRRILAIAALLMAFGLSGCGFHGLNSLRLPGVVGRGSDAVQYRVEVANVATLESNSPVMIEDVVVGSVSKLSVQGWHAVVDVSLKHDVVVPENAVGTVGQTSLLGSMHVSLDPPLGETPVGRLKPGSTIPLSQSSTYPSTEQTLSSLSAVVNGGALGQVGDIIHSLNAALSGRESQVRDLMSRLDNFVGTLNDERDDIVASIDNLNRFSSTFAQQQEVVSRALTAIPRALDVLVDQRAQITTALEKLHTFSDTATGLVNASQADLVKNLQNLEPTLDALANVGSDLGDALAYATHFPFTQDIIDRGIRGDYANFYAVVDLTYARLRRGLFLGTRWGQPGAPLVPAPGEPGNLNYTYDPMSAPITPPPAAPAPNNASPPGGPPPADTSASAPAPTPDTFPPMDNGGG
jgi:phospholipid/cholesterol/gamma-HCH transport system substrate-binding protein